MMDETFAMLDLETTGQKAGCRVLTAGLVFAIPRQGIISENYWRIRLPEQFDMGLDDDASTIKWWREEAGEEARTEAWGDGEDRIALPFVLAGISQAMQMWNHKSVWCHGVGFDFNILEAAYVKAGLRHMIPWHFRQLNDTRSIYKLTGVSPAKVPGQYHKALDDARNQSLALIEALKLLASQGLATLQPALPDELRTPEATPSTLEEVTQRLTEAKLAEDSEELEAGTFAESPPVVAAEAPKTEA